MDDAPRSRMGIVTCVDDKYNYIWSALLGCSELKFPKNSQAKFEPGDIVSYVQTNDVQLEQHAANLSKEDDTEPYEIEKVAIGKQKQYNWKVRVHITFAPPDSDQFKSVVQNSKNMVQAVAYTEDFLCCTDKLLMVPSFKKGIQYELDKVYIAEMTRMPKDLNEISLKVGSLFCLIGEHFCATEDRSNILGRCPWKKKPLELPANNIFEETGLPMVKETNNSQAGQENLFNSRITNMSQQNSFGNGQIEGNDDSPMDGHFYEDEPLAESYAEHQSAREEGTESLGLIVRCEQEYSVIWSPVFDLVRIQLGYDDTHQDNKNSPNWPLCTWINFRCFEDISQLHGGTRCKFTAYDISKSLLSQREVKTIGRGKIAAKMALAKPALHSSEFFLAEEKFYGKVLCSYKDRQLLAQMQSNTGNPVESLAIYTERYQYSKWVVFAIRHNDDWRKIIGLPSSIEEDIRPFFGESSATEPTVINNIGNEGSVLRFKPPADWNGNKEEGDKIIDILGVVTSFDSYQNSLISTRAGIARQPTKMALGTWVRATIKLECHPPPAQQQMLKLPSFVVIKSRKILPPISTRVVNERMLICCNLKRVGNNLENEYLGTVYDFSNLIPLNDDKSSFANGYLAEVSLARAGQDRLIRLWLIQKNHGKYVQGIDSVDLKSSHIPDQLGRTCDDSGTLLVNPEFDADEIPHQEEADHPESDLFTEENEIRATRIFSEEMTPNQTQEKPRCLTSSNIEQPTNSERQERLELYQPVEESLERANGLVVGKYTNYAVINTREYGDTIALARYCDCQESFDSHFALGTFLNFNIAKVVPPEQGILLSYTWMCIPKFRHIRPKFPVRKIMDRDVQVYIECDFRGDNLQYYKSTLYSLESPVGFVMIKDSVLLANDLTNKVAKCWVTHVVGQMSHCWEIIGHKRADGKCILEDLDVLDCAKSKAPVSSNQFHPFESIQLKTEQQETQKEQHEENKRNQLQPQNRKEDGRDGLFVDELTNEMTSQTSKESSSSDADLRKLDRTGYFDFLYGKTVPNGWEEGSDNYDWVSLESSNSGMAESATTTNPVHSNSSISYDENLPRCVRASPPPCDARASTPPCDARASTPPCDARASTPPCIVSPPPCEMSLMSPPPEVFSPVGAFSYLNMAPPHQRQYPPCNPLGWENDDYEEEESEEGDEEDQFNCWESLGMNKNRSSNEQQHSSDTPPLLLLDFDDFLVCQSAQQPESEEAKRKKEQAEREKKRLAEEQKKKEEERQKKRNFEQFLDGLVEKSKKDLNRRYDLLD